MTLQVIGCSHREAPIAVRERLAFSPAQAGAALRRWRDEFPKVEAVLLSTCNRVELYVAGEEPNRPSYDQLTRFLGRIHECDVQEFLEYLTLREGEAAVQHLFMVAASLDSMVLGESQVLAQVKEAYSLANEQGTSGPETHAAFQRAVTVARRVAGETTIQQRRVSIPSVAVGDFAQQIFERFDDKNTLVIGAGEMGEETLTYLREKGARDVTVINRHAARAAEVAERWAGRVRPWSELHDALVEADLVISTTGSEEPVISLHEFTQIEARRFGRPLFVLDLAVPRDFDPGIGSRPEVYLYSIDDLQLACERNRRRRDKELPAAVAIVEQEAARFVASRRHRATTPVIQQLRRDWKNAEEAELKRLFRKLPDLDENVRGEIRHAFDRLVNKLLHPPLESLRDEAQQGIPRALMDALTKLFRLED
jgi:glutamyl-tRNA reductase